MLLVKTIISVMRMGRNFGKEIYNLPKSSGFILFNQSCHCFSSSVFVFSGSGRSRLFAASITFSSTNMGDLVLNARAIASDGRESIEIVILDDKGYEDDLRIEVEDTGVYISQWNSILNEETNIRISNKQWMELIAAINSPEGAFILEESRKKWK